MKILPGGLNTGPDVVIRTRPDACREPARRAREDALDHAALRIMLRLSRRSALHLKLGFV